MVARKVPRNCPELELNETVSVHSYELLSRSQDFPSASAEKAQSLPYSLLQPGIAHVKATGTISPLNCPTSRAVRGSPKLLF